MVKQQKCLAHVLRSISDEVQPQEPSEAADFAAEAERLRREATYHLRDRPMSDADNGIATLAWPPVME